MGCDAFGLWLAHRGLQRFMIADIKPSRGCSMRNPVLYVWLFFSVISGSTLQACTTDDLARMSAASYNSMQAQHLCDVASAFFDRSTRVELYSSSVSRFVNTLTPIDVSLPSPQANGETKVVLQDLRYCSAKSEHEGELLGFGTLPSFSFGLL